MNDLKNTELTPEEQVISKRLRELKMPGMADAFERQILDPNADMVGFFERFTDLVNTEWQIRYDKKNKPSSETGKTPLSSCRSR